MNALPYGRPVLLTLFSRPDTTLRVLEEIRRVRPERLYLACDGARPDRPEEAELVTEVREKVLAGVDWDCEVATSFQDQNLGCQKALSTAVSWFFEHEEAGVILEDDCLPGAGFFRFCDQLLDRYADDDRVMHISGASLVDFGARPDSYFFSRYPLVWGWASWRSAWEEFSLEPPNPGEIARVVNGFHSPEEREYWQALLEGFYRGEIDTWDYAWATSMWRRDGVAVSPTVNLISNIGFGEGSTHTKAWKDYRGLGNRPRQELTGLVPPESDDVDIELDEKLFRGAYRREAAPIVAAKLLRRFVRRS